MEKKIETGIKEYSQTEAALAELRERIGKTQYDVTVPSSMELARKDRRELVSLRTGLESKRKEIKAPALEHCRLIDAEAARITAELRKMEEPIDAIIKAEEARIEVEREKKREIERQRIADIQSRIDIFRNAPLMAAGRSVEQLGNAIIKIGAICIDDTFQELKTDADAAKQQCLISLQELRVTQQALDDEAARIEAERVAKERLEAEERERIRMAQEAEAKRLEAIRLEQEAAAEIERKRQAAVQEELNRQADEQAEALRVEREVFEKQQAETRKLLAEQEEKNNVERAELERQRAEMIETLRKQEESPSDEKIKEEIRAIQEPVKSEEFDIILRKCSAGWLGLTGEYRTGTHHRTAALALKQVEKYIAEQK